MIALSLTLLLVSYAAYAHAPGVATGAALGLAACMAGMVLQHGGNHGSMSQRPLINELIGARISSEREPKRKVTGTTGTRNKPPRTTQHKPIFPLRLVWTCTQLLRGSWNLDTRCVYSFHLLLR